MLFLLKGSYKGMNTLARENILTFLVNFVYKKMLLEHIINVINFFWMPLSWWSLILLSDNTKVSCVCVFYFIMLLTVIIQWMSMEHWTNDSGKEKVKILGENPPQSLDLCGKKPATNTPNHGSACRACQVQLRGTILNACFPTSIILEFVTTNLSSYIYFHTIYFDLHILCR